MRGRLFFIFLFFTLRLFSQNPSSAIGTWKEYLPYYSAIDVAAGNNKIYCATPYSLYEVDPADNSIQRFSKATGLSETGVSAIHYDESTQKLFIAYTNSNIDILYRNDVINIPDIKRQAISGDKSIYNIYQLNGNYYLSTGLGVIVVDANKYEIRDSWFIGSNGNPVRVTGFTSDGNYFYAASEEGLKRISVNDPNPANFADWQSVGGSNGLSSGACRDVITIGSQVYVLKSDSLFVYDGTHWTFFYADGISIAGVNATSGKIAICHGQQPSVSSAVILNTDGSTQKILQQPGVTTSPRKVVILNGEYWLADAFNALSRFSTNATADNTYDPNAPDGFTSGEMVVSDGIFYATAGAVNDSWNYQFDGDGIFRYKDGQWKSYNRVHYSILDSLLDFITIAIDPQDASVWSGSFGGGLLHIKPDESFEIFKQNSQLQQHPLDPGSYRVAGLLFDQQRNLWISNFGAPQPLVVRKPDGSWINFSVPFNLAENALSQIVTDSYNQLWIESPLGNGLVCFNYGNNVDDLSDDHWKLYRAGAGNGNLPSNNVLCVAVDKSGFVWVGTDNGIGIIQCTGEVFNAGCDAILPVVPQGNFAGLLFAGERVESISVDGADRKWVGTTNGVWLISPDGQQVIYHFTADDSPLLGSNVKKIAIDPATGEVFFATDKGLCSFHSDATGGSVTNSKLLVFPNPVPPGFSGMIAIRGVAENAIVKITELNGRLVFQTRALGGQAVWDGRDYKGRKISTGVYLVLVSTDDRSAETVSKIVFISK